ncbi:ABC transporter permease [Micrococcus luteus]|jgi:putative ABC transport system permease protein|nr:ABC-type transport system, involved in lipoprotein release, permease component [Micrococcus luteus NCTC 2665]ORE56698.1 ABC transporter permease [Micrococcus luteus]
MPLPRDPALAGLTVTAGALPAADDARGVTLDAQTADRHGVAVGDVVALAGESGPASATTPVDAVVTGLTEPSPDPMLSGQAQVWASPAALTAVQGEDGEAGFTPHLLLRLADGADVPAVAEAARAEATAAGVDVDVATPDEAVRSAVTQLSGGTDLLGWVLGGFAALALLVTALVIANTFQVLVAQRTRDLALLRTVGSTTAQVRASVLTEAAVVGVVGSVLGAGLAVAIVAGVAAAARAMLDLPFLTFGLHPAGLAVSVAVGVAVTVLAALAPAVAATRVAPLEALRPKDEVTAASRGGRVRTAIGLVLAVGGTALMLGGVSVREPVSAIGGGALSFVGVLLLARLFVPAAVRGAAVLARPAGVPGRLAGLNAVRHRSRTAATAAATAAALLVGTTLVALFLTGGRTAQEQTALALDTAYPVDLVVQLPADADPARAAEAVAATEDVQAVALATPVGATENGSPVLATPAADLRAVVARLPEGVTGLGDPGTALVPDWVDADPVRAEVAGTERTFVPVRAGSLSSGVYVAAEPLREAGWDGAADAAVPGQLLVALDPGVPVDRLQGLSEDVTRAAGAGAAVIDGGAGERALYARIIDAMLGIVVALLAVSVLIALIGVANTLSLSVIERTRENALLRALGLTRGGLRGAIAIEAVLIAAVAAVLGCALGVFYGWAGAQLVLADLSATAGAGTAVRPVVPWLELGLVVAVAALAGLAASLLPARRAARLSPVAGLAAV